jgi:hypothetical protein
MVTRAIIVSALGLASCIQVLGIEDARVDPALAGAGGHADGGAAGSSGAGGANGPGGAGQTNLDGGAGAAMSNGGTDASTDRRDDDDGGSATCRRYCDDIMSYCTGNVKQYLDMMQCLKVCHIFPPGVVDGPDGNTAACRAKYAAKARYGSGSERDAYCRKAGPGSDGTCGAICDGFCTLMMPTCTEQKTAPYFFPTLDACLTTCRSLRDSPPFTVADGTLPDENTAQCRLFHVTSAVMDPDEHCEHAMGVTMCDAKPDAGR